MTVNSVDLSPFAVAHMRLVLLGPTGALSRRVIDSVCSLKESENVSAETLVDQEIAGRTALGTAAARSRASGHPVKDETMLAIMRRWFWSRRKSRGFVLSGFPANVLQAMVFDQWLDERDESLTACLKLEETGTSRAACAVDENCVTAHYRARGLLFDVNYAQPFEAALAGILDFTASLVAHR